MNRTTIQKAALYALRILIRQQNKIVVNVLKIIQCGIQETSVSVQVGHILQMMEFAIFVKKTLIHQRMMVLSAFAKW